MTLVNIGDTLARFRVSRPGKKERPGDGGMREYHSVEEAGKFIDPPVTRQAVHQWIKRGVGGSKLEAFRVGRAYLIQHSALEDFCKSTGKKLKY